MAVDYVGAQVTITTQLSTKPIFQWWKLHTHRADLNSDGFREYMGDARSYVSVPVNWNAFQDAKESKLGDQHLYKTANCNVAIKNNIFADNNSTIGTVTSLPSWVDTSAPLRILVAMVSPTTQDVTMTAFLTKSSPGDTIYTTAQTGNTTGEVNHAIAKTVAAGEQEWFEFFLDISNFGVENGSVFPDIVWINISSTVLPSPIYGLHFELSMLNWRIGSHV